MCVGVLVAKKLKLIIAKNKINKLIAIIISIYKKYLNTFFLHLILFSNKLSVSCSETALMLA